MATLRIIVVEDDEIIASLLADMLRELGHTVCAIEITENAAVTAVSRDRPDLILIDVGLAHGSGFRAMDRITRDGPVAHIFMSGSKHYGLAPGAVVLMKPFRERELVQAMRHALDAVS